MQKIYKFEQLTPEINEVFSKALMIPTLGLNLVVTDPNPTYPNFSETFSTLRI